MSSYVDRIRPDDFGITTYLESLLKGRYQIPTFQRDVVWEPNQVKRLWDSVYRFYPMGSILVWITPTRLEKHREIGGHALSTTAHDGEFKYILDGQQRTTALLTAIHGGTIKDREDWDPTIYVDLTVTDPEDLEDDTWRERFLYWNEIDDREGTLLRNRGRQQRFDEGLIVSLLDIHQRYQEIEKRLEERGHSYRDPPREQLRTFKQVLDNYKVPFIELRGIQVAEVCQIFERVNQEGTSLDMFDIVVAKTYRPPEDGGDGFYLRGLFEGFWEELQSRGSNYASRDHETLLEMVAVLVREVVEDSGVHNITPTYLNALRTEHIQAVWPEGERAARQVFDFLDNHLHLPGPALVPSRYFYTSLVAYFHQNREPDYDLLNRYFWTYSFHYRNPLRNTTALREHIAEFQRVKKGGRFDLPELLIDREQLRGTTYSSRGRLSRAILALYANQIPRDWLHPDRSVLQDVYYELTDRPNLHHIFPLDFCRTHLDERYAEHQDSLMNIAYLRQLTNLKFSNRNPLEYIRPIRKPGFENVVATHLLPDNLIEWVEQEELPPDALNQFVEARIDRVVERLRGALGDHPVRVIDTRGEGEPGDAMENGEIQ